MWCKERHQKKLHLWVHDRHYHDTTMHYTRGAQIFQTSRSHLGILGARSVIWSKFLTDGPQLLGAAINKSDATETWQPCTKLTFQCKQLKKNLKYKYLLQSFPANSWSWTLKKKQKTSNTEFILLFIIK